MEPSRLVLFKGRSTFLKLFFSLLFILLVSRLFYVQLYQSSFLEKVSESRIVSKHSINVARGSILDRNNKYLALDIVSYTLQVDLPNFSSKGEDLTKLLNILNMKKEVFLKKILGKKRGSFQIKRHLSLEHKKKIQKLNIDGISFLRDLKRSYPQQEISAHAVGITDIDRNGLQGTEKLFDNYLKSITGSFFGLQDRKGNKLGGQRIEPVRGKDISMTLDIRLQSIAYSELEASVKENKAKSGSIVMVDPLNSEILTMVNYPSFKPSDRKELTDFSVLRNRSAIDLFQPGSVVKPLAMAAIIDFSELTSEYVVDTSPGWIDFEGYKTRDYRNYGVLNLSEIISKSSNVGMIKLCSKVDKDFLYNYLSRFTIGRHPASILINAREGFLSYTDRVTERDKVSACYGYGMSVTAMHLAQAYTILATNGIYKELRLFKDFEHMPKIQGKRVFSKKTSLMIGDMLREAVNGEAGTARGAKIKGILASGKTGTAIKKVKNNKSYSTIFAGYAPSHNPSLVAVIVLHGLEGDEVSAGSTAAPLFSKVMEQSLYILDTGK